MNEKIRCCHHTAELLGWASISMFNAECYSAMDFWDDLHLYWVGRLDCIHNLSN